MLFIAACAVILPASGASAHTDLVSTVPATGAVLSSAPDAVILTFDEDLLAAAAEASILDSSGGLVREATATVSGAVATIAWPTDLGSGAYQVAYRVASGDGHPITGSLQFSYTVASGAAGQTAQSPEPAAAPTATATSAPVPGGAMPNLFVIGALLVAVAIAGAIVVVRRGRK